MLSDLGRRTFTQAYGRLYQPEDRDAFLSQNHSIEAYTRLIGDPMSGVWLARGEDGVAEGYVVAGPCGLPVPNMPPRSGEVRRLYLLEGRRSAGIGARLLETAISWLRERYDHIYLSVYAENHRAQQFYERHGFEKHHRYNFLVGKQADPEWIMKLTSSPR